MIGFLLWEPALAQAPAGAQEDELRRQLQSERAARRALTYQADMRKAGQLAEAEQWPALRALLERYRPGGGDGESDVRSWEWFFLQSLALKNQLVDGQESVFQSPSTAIHQLAWSGDGARLAAISEEGEVVLWDVKTGKALRRLGGRARFAAWSPDGSVLTLSAENGTVTLWPAEPGPARRFFGPVEGLFHYRRPAFSPDGRTLALAVDQTTAAIHDVALPGLERRRLTGHQGLVLPVAWEPGGRRLATGSKDGTVKIWDAATGRETTSLRSGRDVVGLQWGADGRQIAAVAWPPAGVRKVFVWDLASGERIFTADSPAGTYGPHQRQVAVLLSPDGKRVAAETLSGFTVWDRAPVRVILSGPAGGHVAQANGCDPEVTRWAFLEMVGSRATGRVLDVETHEELFRVEVEIPMNRYGSALAWSPDGRRIATGFSQGKVLIFKVPRDRSESRIFNAGTAGFFEWSPTGERFAFLSQGEVRVGSVPVTSRPALVSLSAGGERPSVARLVAWAPDGRWLATLAGDSTSDARIDLWDAATAKKLQTLTGDRIGFRDAAALAWSPDGQRLACVAGSIQVWARTPLAALPMLPLGVTVRPAPKPGSEADLVFASFSGDSRNLAVLECRHSTGHEATVTAWDLNTRQERFSWTRPYEQSLLHAPLAWSPDGQRLAWGGPGAAVWNVAAGREEFPLAGHGAPVADVAWSPDGRRVLSRCEVYGGFTRNFELKVWDPETGYEVLMLRGPMAGLLVAPGFQALAWPPGRGSDPGDVVVWDVGPRDK
jgi:WD40 repeat protein